MNNHNEITIYGRLGKNPELRLSKKSEAFCTFTVAEPIDGQEQPRWYNVVIWGKQAEHWAEVLKKGSAIFVRGQKREREFTNTQGEKKLYQEVKADAIGFTYS